MKCVFIGVNDFATQYEVKKPILEIKIDCHGHHLNQHFNYNMGIALIAHYIRTSIKLVMNVTQNCNDLFLLTWRTVHIENPYPMRTSTKLQPLLPFYGYHPSSSEDKRHFPS